MDLIRKGSSVERGQTAKWKQVELLDLSDLSDLSELVRLVRLFPKRTDGRILKKDTMGRGKN
jgi:hypothetical protein